MRVYACLGDSHVKAHCLDWCYNDPCHSLVLPFSFRPFVSSIQNAILRECMKYTLICRGQWVHSKLTTQCKCMAVLGDSHLKAHCLGWYHNDPCYIYIRHCFDLAGFRLSTQSALLLSPSQCAWWLWCASSLRKNNNPFRFCDCVLRQRIVAYSSCIENITYIDTRTYRCVVFVQLVFKVQNNEESLPTKGPRASVQQNDLSTQHFWGFDLRRVFAISWGASWEEQQACRLSTM